MTAPAGGPGTAHYYLNPGEIETIIGLLDGIGARTVVEFGCNIGQTAAAILRALPAVTAYIGIEVPPRYITRLPMQRAEVTDAPGALALGDPRFRLLVRPLGSYDVRPDELPVCDAAFIDGDHSRAGVLNDYRLARARTRPGGLILFHDDNGLPGPEVTRTLRELVADGARIEHIDGTWLAYETVPGEAADG